MFFWTFWINQNIIYKHYNELIKVMIHPKMVWYYRLVRPRPVGRDSWLLVYSSGNPPWHRSSQARLNGPHRFIPGPPRQLPTTARRLKGRRDSFLTQFGNFARLYQLSLNGRLLPYLHKVAIWKRSLTSIKETSHPHWKGPNNSMCIQPLYSNSLARPTSCSSRHSCGFTGGPPALFQYSGRAQTQT